MAGRRESSALALGAIGVVAAIVVLLALLQYRWTGQVSRAEQERLRATLAASANRFRQEFHADLVRLCMALQLDPAGEVSQLEANAAIRYGEWANAAADPGLVAGVYVWHTADAPRLLALDRRSFRFQETEWPKRFAALQAFLFSQLQELAEIGEREAYHQPWTLHESTPALVQPLFHVPPGLHPLGASAEHVGFLIVELNADYLRQTYLPRLVERSFGSREGLEFAVAVHSASDPSSALFRSEGSEDAAAGKDDVVLDLLMPEEDRWMGRRGVVLEPSSLENRWQVVVRFRAGSLEKSVSALRWRNLALSFGLLFLLAASMGLTVALAHRARNLARAQMEFVAGVSHELRTPLAVICSAAENLADGVAAGPQKARDYGSLIAAEARRLTRLVEQVLLSVAGAARSSSYELRQVDVVEAIDKALAEAGPALESAGFHLEREVPEGLPKALADPAALQQCLSNLIQNAVKYAADGGWLAVRARLVRQGDRSWIEIRLEDKGPGIPAAEARRIFAPFFRAKAARERQIGGVGLGLHLVKRMMEGMGGWVSVSSRPGRGAVFTLHLAAAGEQAGAQSK